MGNQPAKKQINPNVEEKQPNNPSSDLEQYIKQTFKKASSNGVLTKDKFNQTLAILEGNKFKRLRDTPLAERLFVLFDKDRTGKISESQVTRGLTEIFSDKNNAVMYSFRVYDQDQDNRISRRQFVTFIEESWKAAFRILGETAEKAKNISLGDVTNWSSNKISLLNEQSTKIFNTLDAKRTGFIEYIAFKEWVLNGSVNSILAELEDITVEVPIHLIKIRRD